MYEASHSDFYSWEESYCENTLTSLQAPLQTEAAILASC